MSSTRHSKRANGWSSQRDILDQRLAPATLTNYRREFKQFLVYWASLGLQQFNWTIHCVRAGGATEARLLGWSMEAIKERALWESSKSADHYIRMSLGLNEFHLLSNDIMSWGKCFDRNVFLLFV